jgi:flagellar hook-associated protein 1 FlgK
MSFYGLEMGKRTMMAHQAALNVVGQNISNASTEGYSRQIATLQAQSVYSPQYGTLGSGVDMLTVKRARNEFIDDRMVKETSQLSKWEVREINLENIQNVFNEPNDSTIRDSLDSMWSSFQDLANNSQESATRETVLERADDLASMIKDGYSQLKSLQSEMDGTIKTEVENVNSTLKKIADLNAQISRIERDDVTNANDLRDERDRLTEGLSKVIDLKVNRDNGEFSIIIDGRTAVQGENYQQLQTVPDVDNSNRLKMQWTDTKKDVSITGGKIGAYRELRDDDIQKYIEDELRNV